MGKECFERALEIMTCRGPDDRGMEEVGGGRLGFRRLSILDLTLAGRQPMKCGEQNWLVFNGEIYNFRSLREELGLTATSLPSSGDTAILGELLRRHGVWETVKRLRGMFGFCWVDGGTGEVWAVRDPFGIKPVYYAEAPGGGLIVGSDPTSVRMLLGRRGDPSALAIAQFVSWGCIHGPGTVFSEVRLLPPGSLLRYKNGRLEEERYFEMTWGASSDWLADGEAEQRAKATLMDSVRVHLASDVPLGVLLSGGLDSSLICGLMRSNGVEQIEAFSLGFEESEAAFDEVKIAEKTARFYGASFHHQTVGGGDVLSTLDHFLRHLHQPSGDALNTYLAIRLAARRVEVVLSGLGADEWFAGYNHYRFLEVAQRFPVWKLWGKEGCRWLAKCMDALPAELRIRRSFRALATVLGGCGYGVSDMVMMSRLFLPGGGVRDCLGPGIREELNVDTLEKLTPDYWPATPERLQAWAPDSWLHQALLLDTLGYLIPMLLRDSDATSMAHSVEMRVPFVDLEVFRLSATTSPQEKFGGGVGKRLLRKAFRDLLPPWISETAKKRTFTLPTMNWLRTRQWRDRVHDVLGSRRFVERGWISPGYAMRCLKEFYGLIDQSRRTFQYSQKIWLLFILESWARIHFDGFGELMSTNGN